MNRSRGHAEAILVRWINMFVCFFTNLRCWENARNTKTEKWYTAVCMLLIKMSITLSQKMQNKVVRSDSDASTCELLTHHFSTHLCCHCRGGRVTDLSLLVFILFVIITIFLSYFWLQNKANNKTLKYYCLTLYTFSCLRFELSETPKK